MKYIFFTYNGLGMPLAYKLQNEGNEVIVGLVENVKDYIIEEEIENAQENELSKGKRLLLFNGMLDIQPADKVIDKMKLIEKPYEYFIFFDENNLYRWANKVGGMGFEGIFPTKEDYLFEIDREKAKLFVKNNYPRLYVPEIKKFSRIGDVIPFLENSNDIWVLKGNYETAKSYIPDTTNPEVVKIQIIETLQRYQQRYEKLGFVLEMFIPQIIELTPEIMFYDGVPICATINIENKNFGSGNISVQTGCAQDLVFPISLEERIVKISFPDIINKMARNHKGLFVWDASLLINKRDGKIYFGEFCSNRVGYNSIFTELSQCSSVNDFFEKLVHKTSPFIIGTVGGSTRIFNLNRDPETEQISSDISIDYEPGIEKDLWLWDVKKNGQGRLVSVGFDWNLAVITGSGKLIDEAINKLFKNINDLSFRGAYYRSKDDYLSLDYPTSILNRLNYGLERGLYKLPFDVKVGDIV